MGVTLPQAATPLDTKTPWRQASGSRQRPPKEVRSGHWVVVEGKEDAAAVVRAVRAQVYVLGTASHARHNAVLRDVVDWLGPTQRSCLKILMDPDTEGRRGRTLFHDLEGCLHAFIPTSRATAGKATRHHKVGNVGVEHASPHSIRYALKKARPFDSARQAFSRDDMTAARLTVPFDQGIDASTAKNAQRRKLVCDFWGLGDCNGKQLMKQLNQYCFTQAELEEALQYAERTIQLQDLEMASDETDEGTQSKVLEGQEQSMASRVGRIDSFWDGPAD